MDFIKTILNQGWVGSLIGLISLIVAFALYRKSRIGARLCYQSQALKLIGKKHRALPEDVEIFYKGNKVDRLTKVYIVIWNSGKAILDGSDLIKEDPLRFEINEGEKFLSANILKITREPIKIKAFINPEALNQLIINFGYLDPGDGAVIELLHTDVNSYPSAKGTIKGLPKGVIYWGYIPYGKKSSSASIGFNPFPFNLSRKGFYIIALISGIMLTIFGAISILYSNIANAIGATREFGWTLAITGGLYSIAVNFMFGFLRRKFPMMLQIDDFN